MRRARVGVRDLRVECILGTKEEERIREQPVLVSLEFEYDAEPAAKRDNITEAINYDRVVSMVTEHLMWQKYQLMEAACGGVISMLQDAYPELLVIRIEISKPLAVPTAQASYCTMSWTVPGGGQP